VWAVGEAPLLGYTVRAAARALVAVKAAGMPGELRGRGVRPKLWGTPDNTAAAALPSATMDIHARQQERFAAARQAGSSSRAEGSRVRERDLSSQLYAALWQQPSPERAHVLQRVQASQSALTQWRVAQEQQQQQVLHPRVDDAAWDVQPVPVWASAWRRVWHPGLPRSTQVFGWRLLHAALPVGGALVFMCRPGGMQLGECTCVHPACQALPSPPLETLQHLFLECPVGSGALQHLGGLWGRIAGDHNRPPLEARVVLADDHEGWKPAGGLHTLWTFLRLTMLGSVWAVRCRAKAEHGAFHLQGVLAAFVAQVRAAILQDWLRVQQDVRLLAGVPPAWFAGRDPALTADRFQKKWCVRGVLASLEQEPGGRQKLCLHVGGTSGEDS
jgi:hypothetical protein